MAKNFRGVSIPEALALEIEVEVLMDNVDGYMTLAGFVQDGTRRRLDNIRERLEKQQAAKVECVREHTDGTPA